MSAIRELSQLGFLFQYCCNTCQRLRQKILNIQYQSYDCSEHNDKLLLMSQVIFFFTVSILSDIADTNAMEESPIKIFLWVNNNTFGVEVLIFLV